MAKKTRSKRTTLRAKKTTIAKKTRLRRAKDLTGGDAAVGRMNDALIAESKKIKEQWNATEMNDVQARYRLARQFEKIRAGDGEDKKYGAGAVQKLADSLGLSKSTINEYANVAKAWPREREFELLVAKKDKFEKPLSWSHFVVLAAVEDDTQRKQLLVDTFKYGWSVRDLKRGGQVAESSDDPTTLQPELPRTLAVMTRQLLTQLETARQNTKVFSQAVCEYLRTTEAAELTDGLLEKMRQAHREIDAIKSDCDKVDKYVALIEQRRKSDENQ